MRPRRWLDQRRSVLGESVRGLKRSLELQGGIFTDAEAQRFISQPHAQGAVSVRIWDDAAKVENADTPPLGHYLALAERIALRR